MCHEFLENVDFGKESGKISNSSVNQTFLHVDEHRTFYSSPDVKTDEILDMSQISIMMITSSS